MLKQREVMQFQAEIANLTNEVLNDGAVRGFETYRKMKLINEGKMDTQFVNERPTKPQRVNFFNPLRQAQPAPQPVVPKIDAIPPAGIKREDAENLYREIDSAMEHQSKANTALQTFFEEHSRAIDKFDDLKEKLYNLLYD